MTHKNILSLRKAKHAVWVQLIFMFASGIVVSKLNMHDVGNRLMFALLGLGNIYCALLLFSGIKVYFKRYNVALLYIAMLGFTIFQIASTVFGAKFTDAYSSYVGVLTGFLYVGIGVGAYALIEPLGSTARIFSVLSVLCGVIMLINVSHVFFGNGLFSFLQISSLVLMLIFQYRLFAVGQEQLTKEVR